MRTDDYALYHIWQFQKHDAVNGSACMKCSFLHLQITNSNLTTKRMNMKLLVTSVLCENSENRDKIGFPESKFK